MKLEVPPPVEGVGLPLTARVPKQEPRELKFEEPLVAAASGVVVAQPSKKRPWTKESISVPFSALSRTEMALMFDKASGHLVTEVD